MTEPFNRQEFNEAMARLDGLDEEFISANRGYPDYYSDMNYLMPLAWKYGIDTTWNHTARGIEWAAFSSDTGVLIEHEDPKQALRLCLLELYQQQKGK